MSKQLAVVTLLLSIVVVAIAYQFDDPIYNQILANEIEDLESALDEPHSHLRIRRSSGECGHMHGKKLCCAEETFHALHKQTEDLRKKCFKDHKDNTITKPHDPFSCEAMQEHKRVMLCASKCMAEDRKVVDHNGEVNKEKFADDLKSQMSSESWFGSIADHVIETCYKEAQNTSEVFKKSQEKSCNPAAATLMHCVFKEIQMTCPPEAVDDKEVCDKFREKMNQNGGHFPPPPMDH